MVCRPRLLLDCMVMCSGARENAGMGREGWGGGVGAEILCSPRVLTRSSLDITNHRPKLSESPANDFFPR